MDGLDQLEIEPGVDRLPEIAHVHVHDVGAGIEGVPPYALDDAPPREDLILVPQEELEQLEETGRQVDLAAGANEYLVKSEFQQARLLATLERLL